MFDILGRCGIPLVNRRDRGDSAARPGRRRQVAGPGSPLGETAQGHCVGVGLVPADGHVFDETPQGGAGGQVPQPHITPQRRLQQRHRRHPAGVQQDARQHRRVGRRALLPAEPRNGQERRGQECLHGESREVCQAGQ